MIIVKVYPAKGVCMESRNRKRGAYGAVSLDRVKKLASKQTLLFDAYHKQERHDPRTRYLLSGNLREAIFMRYLVDNPIEGVISVKSVSIQNDGSICSQMELGEVTLYDFVNMHTFKNRMRVFDMVFRDVALALVNLHHQGFVHGDLKPSNIVRIGSEDSLKFKLVDFGGFSWYTQIINHVSLGTYVTRAPELYGEKVRPEPICDAWSLGATMYFYCTRRYLVEDKPDNPEEDVMDFILKQHQAGLSIKFPKDFDENTKDMILGLLEYDPAKRMSCSQCLQKYFEIPLICDAAASNCRMKTSQMFCLDRISVYNEIEKIKSSSIDQFHKDLFNMITSMCEKREEWACIPAMWSYIKLFCPNLSEKDVLDVRAWVSACFVLARGIIYDEDTCEFSMTEGVRNRVIQLLQTSNMCLFRTRSSLFPARPIIVSIDGNIGASKSTVISKLAGTIGSSHINYVQEPVEEWINLLEKYYEDQSRWCMPLHVKILLSFKKIYDSAPRDKITIIERSAWSCVNIFQNLLFEKGVISPEENELVNNLFTMMPYLVPDMLIYLKCDPDVCAQRILGRGRGCERDIPIEYIHELHQQYENVMNDSTKAIKYVVTVDTSNKSVAEVVDAVYTEISNILV